MLQQNINPSQKNQHHEGQCKKALHYVEVEKKLNVGNFESLFLRIFFVAENMHNFEKS